MKSTKTCSKCIEAAAPKFSKPIQLLVLNDDNCCLLCREQVGFEVQMKHWKKCKFGNPKVTVEQQDFSREQGQKRCAESPKSDLESAKRKKRRFCPPKQKQHDADKDIPAEDPVEFDGIYRLG